MVSLKQETIFPLWTQELLTLHNARVSRQFVLHFNITDFVVDLMPEQNATQSGLHPTTKVYGEAQPFREYLRQFLYSRFQCQIIYTYSLAEGLVIDDTLNNKQRQLAKEYIDRARQEVTSLQQQMNPEQAQNTRANDTTNEVSTNLKVLGHMLRQRYPINASAKEETEEAPIAVVFDYAEKLIPFGLGEGRGTREQLQTLEMLQRWALDPQIRRNTSNIILLLTTNIGQIAENVYAAGSGCRAIRIPLPDAQEREAFITWRREEKRFPQLDPTDVEKDPIYHVKRLAHEMQGMRLTDIDNLSRRIIQECYDRGEEPPILRSVHIQHEKASVIQAQSEQLLEIIQPRRGFSEIGGLNKLKDYLRQRTKQMRHGQHTLLVPSGLLLAGPPGTGKTIIAEAMATESGFNLVKMRNIQDKWIGSSERNLELVISLLKDLHPVIVFVDEIDQAMVKRDTGHSGDSGVGARMFARILEEMSNAANRGRILWIAATNRVDLLDDALLRRFDRVIPLLAPDVDEACRIFATMPMTIRMQTDDAVNVKYSGDLSQSGKTVQGRPSPTEKDLACFREVASEVVRRGLTGAGIEIVVRRAAEIACEEVLTPDGEMNEAYINDLPGIQSSHLLKAIKDYKANQNRNVYDFQSLLAIRGCNFQSVMPELPNRDIFDHVKDENGDIDPGKVEEQIRNLKVLFRYDN